MRTAYAFLKKEWMEYYRTGKLIPESVKLSYFFTGTA